ncbi:MAG: ABC transporter permease [Acidimicrobiales bacterium]
MGPALDSWPLAACLVALATLTVAVARWSRQPIAGAVVRAEARAVVQLLVVAVVLAAALQAVWSAVIVGTFMLTVAAVTAAGRVEARHAVGWTALAIAGGAAPVLALAFGTGAVPVSPPSVVSITGIVVGGTMTAVVLAGRRAMAEIERDRGEVEAAMALGFRRSPAIRMLIERNAAESLVPVLDQTRTVGLVSLPGAFIGVLLGGGSAADAAAAQLVVLFGLIASETIGVVLTTRLVAAGKVMPRDLASSLPPD